MPKTNEFPGDDAEKAKKPKSITPEELRIAGAIATKDSLEYRRELASLNDRAELGTKKQLYELALEMTRGVGAVNEDEKGAFYRAAFYELVDGRLAEIRTYLHPGHKHSPKADILLTESGIDVNGDGYEIEETYYLSESNELDHYVVPKNDNLSREIERYDEDPNTDMPPGLSSQEFLDYHLEKQKELGINAPNIEAADELENMVRGDMQVDVGQATQAQAVKLIELLKTGELTDEAA